MTSYSKLIRSALSLLFILIISSNDACAWAGPPRYYDAVDSYLVLKNDAKKNCSEKSFNYEKCKSQCEILKKFDDKDRIPNECDNLKKYSQKPSTAAPAKTYNNSGNRNTSSTAKKTILAKAKCLRLQENISNKLHETENVKIIRKEAIDNVLNRIDTIAVQLYGTGLNTSRFESDRSRLHALSIGSDKSYAAYRRLMNDTKVSACEWSIADINNNIGEAKKNLQAFNENSRNIKEMVLSGIKPDILDLKSQLGLAQK